MPVVEWNEIEQAPPEGYRSSGIRAGWAMILVALATVAIGLEVVVVLQGWSFIDRYGSVSLDEVTAWQRDLNAVSGLYFLTIVAAAIAVVAWLSRVVDNVRPLTGEVPVVSPRWAIAVWFLPFVNFVMPYRVVADTWRKLATAESERGTGLVLVWWLLWISGAITNRLIGAVAAPDDAAGLRITFLVIIAAAIGQLIAGVLLIAIIRQIERRSEARAAADHDREAGTPTPATDVATNPSS